MRIFRCGVIQHGNIGEDQRIGTELRGHIHGAFPALIAVRVRKCIDGDMQLTSVAVNVICRLLQFLLREVQACKVACIGVIFQADIYRISTVIDGRF